MKIIGIIPCRNNSSRFPGKPLLDLGGKPMVQRVYEQAQKSILDQLIVATDDERIYNSVLAFGGKAVMTSYKHRSGTDRCLEALQKMEGNFDGIINIQGDEPFIHPEQITQIAHCLQQKNTQIVTLGKLLLERMICQTSTLQKCFLTTNACHWFRKKVNFDYKTNTIIMLEFTDTQVKHLPKSLIYNLLKTN